ncbi:hypothetical protein DFH06DRAFT_1133596 [Mycena polygramma]|nr:hypothetical protein DFH06DRAFT_1133596 [Mycena polygramma]
MRKGGYVAFVMREAASSELAVVVFVSPLSVTSMNQSVEPAFESASAHAMMGTVHWGILSTGLITKDHAKLFRLAGAQRASVSDVDEMPKLYLAETFEDAVKSLAGSATYSHFFVRRGGTVDFNESATLYYVTPGGYITDDRTLAEARYYGAWTNTADIVVAASYENAKESWFFWFDCISGSGQFHRPAGNDQITKCHLMIVICVVWTIRCNLFSLLW